MAKIASLHSAGTRGALRRFNSCGFAENGFLSPSPARRLERGLSLFRLNFGLVFIYIAIEGYNMLKMLLLSRITGSALAICKDVIFLQNFKAIMSKSPVS